MLFFANDCWQTDTLIEPYFTQNGKKKRTYLIAFLDDTSRLLVHGEFFTEENTVSLQTVLKRAILKRGIPKQIFCDNGKVFDSLQLRMVCASLGIHLSHARPYSPSSKGKIERMFRTVRMQFLDPLDLEEIHSLTDLNTKFFHYVDATYNLHAHSSLQGLAPLERLCWSVTNAKSGQLMRTLFKRFRKIPILTFEWRNTLVDG